MNQQNALNDVRCSDTVGKERYVKHCMFVLQSKHKICSLLIGPNNVCLIELHFRRSNKLVVDKSIHSLLDARSTIHCVTNRLSLDPHRNVCFASFSDILTRFTITN